MSRFRKVVIAVSCVLLLLGISVPLLAQGAPEGRIVGVVRDPSGAVVPGASISVVNEGTSATFNVTASADGNFVVPSLPVGSYTVNISAKGFATATYKQVKVETSKEYSLTVSLKVGGTSETVEVQAGQELVNTTSSEVSTAMTPLQVQNLPLNGRDITQLIYTQAGVSFNGRQNTTVNGSKPSWSQVTLDGINIQDLYIRTNALDYIPNRPTTDTVAEFTISTSGQGVDAAMGANGVRMITPSGTNNLHGSAYYYNRNSAAAANEWFNDHDGVPKPFLNRNEFGASVGGPVIKNKLFFFGSYVGQRLRSMGQSNLTIPAYDDYLTGVFRYVRPQDGQVVSVNVLDMGTPLTVDPKMQSFILSLVPAASNVNNYQVGNSKANQLLNTAGWMFNTRGNYSRDNAVGKVDFEASQKHHFNFVFNYMKEFTDRNDIDLVHPVPWVWNDSSPKMFSGGWRWTASSNFVNEFRTGANLVNAPFLVDPRVKDAGMVVSMTGSGLSNPKATFLPQGRNPANHQYMDDASYMKGSHYITFGGSLQQQNLYTYDDYNTIPTFTTGYSTATGGLQLLQSMFPCPDGWDTETQGACRAISSGDWGRANSLRAFLAGMIKQTQQTFNATSATSGYVPGATNGRNLQLQDTNLYVQDKWRMRSNLTVNVGVKWEYLSPYKEKNGLMMGPFYDNWNDPVQSLMNPNGRVGLIKQTWNKQLTNFGPALGFAWDPFKNGKTSIRGGYTLAYVNDEIYRFAGNAADGNAGLSSTVNQYDLSTTLNANPTVPTPTFVMPRTYADQLAVSSTNVVWALDPNAKVPKVHEVNFGIERELPSNMAASVRYVGTFGRDLLRGFDYNQTRGGSDPTWLADFARARQNLFLSMDAGGFSPLYDPNIAGSQPLTILTNAGLGTPANYDLSLDNTVLYYLYYGQPADLAAYFVQNRSKFATTPGLFLPNPGIWAVDYGTNGAQNGYHSLQAELRRRYANGLQFQANYVFSKNLTNSPGGSGQTRFDPLLDNARPWLAKGRSDLDLKHAFKLNAIYDLPFGKGKKLFGNAPSAVNKVIGGWQLSGIYVWQSGNPFSILFPYGTFNRSARSGYQTAVSTLTENQLKALLGVHMSNGEPYYISNTVIDPASGTATGNDINLNNTAIFNGQVFFQPNAGQVGNMGILPFDGPAYTNLDFGLAKTTQFNERFKLTFRADAFNALNHPTFYFGDQDITSTDFGKIQYTNTSSRKLQFGLRLEF